MSTMDLIVKLHDHNDDSQYENRWSFKSDAKVDELKAKVKSILRIEEEYQVLTLLFPNGGTTNLALKDGTLEKAGAQHGSTVIVKHSGIDVWAKVVKDAEDISMLPTAKRPVQAKLTLDLIEHLLQKEKFFDRYPGLCSEMGRISHETREYLGGDSHTMKTATNLYFFEWLQARKYLKDPRTFAVRYDREADGVHFGSIATVCHDGTTDVYYIKTHLNGPTNSSSESSSSPNLREVFAYILLESIGLGPECHFFGPFPGFGKTTLYIGTKSIPNLELMEFATKNSQNIERIILEMQVASSILCLDDVHGRNCGFNDGSRIFDFCVPPLDDYKMDIGTITKKHLQCVDTSVNGQLAGAMSHFAKAIDEKTRKEVGKTLVQEWKMLERVDAAVNEVTLVKERIRKQGGIIEDTVDFDKYVEGVKHNISLLN